MYKILEKKILCPQIKEIVLDTPAIAQKAQAGQFIVIRIDEKGERIPLTVADYNREKGTMTVIFQEAGKTTQQLGSLNKGDFIMDVAGPMGIPSSIDKVGTVVCVGGGVGSAALYILLKAFKNAGNKTVAIMGAKTKEFLFWEEKIKSVSSEMFITTDDGSCGRKGFVTEELESFIKNEKCDLIFAVGPMVMMNAVCRVSEPYKIKTIVSLNSIMVDATGMCGACRVEVGGETKFACVDGPDFDGHKVNFQLLLQRQKMYLTEEKTILEMGKMNGQRECRCKNE